jgi:DNA ligase-associated metallophosphoesterase
MKELIIRHKVCGQTFQLLPEKAMLWEEKGLLIIADLHLGKAGHFRKSGIPVSDLVHSKDMLNLNKVIQNTKPSHVIFLGDLFHSEVNQSWSSFKRWLSEQQPLTFTLVMGNHDVLPPDQYRIQNLDIQEELSITPFKFTHIPEEEGDLYNIAGHVHPAVRLRGKGRQSVKAPCFHFGKTSALLPAFGAFTGTAGLKVNKDDVVYILAEDEVIRVN